MSNMSAVVISISGPTRCVPEVKLRMSVGANVHCHRSWKSPDGVELEVLENIFVEQLRVDARSKTTIACTLRETSELASSTKPQLTIMATFMGILSNRGVLQVFAAVNIACLAGFGGAAMGMYLFSIPIIQTGRDFSTKVMLRQFHHLITLGARYMQNGSRVQALSLLTLSWLCYRHPDDRIHGAWLHFAAALFVLVQIAWYEVVFVFPYNDALIEMERRLERVDVKSDRAVGAEGNRLLEGWRMWHIGRIAIPFIAAAIALRGLSVL